MSSLFDPRRVFALPAAFQAFQRAVARDDTLARLQREFLKILPGQRVLDIGCGTANILAELPPDVIYHGYDLSARYIAEARRKYGARGTFEVRAVAPYAVKAIGEFDTIIAIGVLHHLNDDEGKTVFASAAKLLKPGGRVLTLDGVLDGPAISVKRLLLWLDRGRYVRSEKGYRTLAMPYFSSIKTTIIRDLLAIPYDHCFMEATKT